MAPKSNFWRIAGLSYLQFLTVSSQAVRNALKVGKLQMLYLKFIEPTSYRLFPLYLNFIQEPARSRALGRQAVSYNKFVGDVKSKFHYLDR